MQKLLMKVERGFADMSRELVNHLGSFEPDNLIAGVTPPAIAVGVKIAGGEGLLKRGTVLSPKAGGTCVICGKQSVGADTPGYILAEDVDASGEAVVATAYRSGNFHLSAVIVESSYTLTAADRDALRKYDIILTDMVKN